ncbi:MAG: class I tRNA ligase family protein, partial [Candidatus Bathyarchaeia archaeon]
MELRPKIEEKRWKVAREAEILDSWEREGTFAFDSDSDKTVFSIDTPPPYASGRWHVGGATHYSQIDMVARYNRMKGYEVLFAFGIDRNGLPVEMEVEKKNNIRAFQTPREKFIDLCKNYLDTVESEILNTAKRLGMSSDFKNAYRTDSPDYRRLTQDTFLELWHKGLVYEDDRPTNWCPVCDTTIADAEIEYVHLPTQLVYMKFKVKEGGEV